MALRYATSVAAAGADARVACRVCTSVAACRRTSIAGGGVVEEAVVAVRGPAAGALVDEAGAVVWLA
jgi:hypothetical protein